MKSITLIHSPTTLRKTLIVQPSKVVLPSTFRIRRMEIRVVGEKNPTVLSVDIYGSTANL